MKKNWKEWTTKEEKDIAYYHRLGCDVKEIATILCRTPKSIDSRIAQMRDRGTVLTPLYKSKQIAFNKAYDVTLYFKKNRKGKSTHDVFKEVSSKLSFDINLGLFYRMRARALNDFIIDNNSTLSDTLKSLKSKTNQSTFKRIMSSREVLSWLKLITKLDKLDKDELHNTVDTAFVESRNSIQVATRKLLDIYDSRISKKVFNNYLLTAIKVMQDENRN